MGMFKNLRDINKMAKDMGGERPSMKEGLAQAKDALANVQEMQQKQTELMQNGVAGQATIKQLSDTGMLVNNMPQISFELEVTIDGRDPYVVEHQQVVQHASLGSLQPGATVPVKVDRNDPANLIIAG